MKITAKHIGRRVYRIWWAQGEWYRVMMLGDHIVVVKDQNGREVILDRDDRDLDWMQMPLETQEFPLQEGASS